MDITGKTALVTGANRGIGRAMTTAALHAARGRGARQASLDASTAGVRIYTRLGFEASSAVTRFRRTG